MAPTLIPEAPLGKVVNSSRLLPRIITPLSLDGSNRESLERSTGATFSFLSTFSRFSMLYDAERVFTVFPPLLVARPAFFY